jgi:copper chaperone
METVTLHISGMACGGCANTVRQALLAVDGVSAADVSHAEAKADITYDAARVTVAQLQQAVEAAGYTVTR